MSIQTINIRMFGSFMLQADWMSQPLVGSLSGRSRRLWALIAYLIINKKRGVPAQELVDVLWPEGAGSNPLSTLHNNVSRARALLKENGFENAKDYISYEKGLYRWAPDIITVLDVEQFESRISAAESQLAKPNLGKDSQAEALSLAIEALELYKGEFLSGSSADIWCINQGMYYRALYVRAVKSVIRHLAELGRYSEVEHICMQALTVDPSVEDFSIYLMRSLVVGGNPSQALEHYETVKQMYAEKYNCTPSAGIELERAAAMNSLYGEELPEKEIQDFLLVPKDDKGAYFCNNLVFREMVQLFARSSRRSKRTAQIVVISAGEDASTADATLEERQTQTLQCLQAAVTRSLREGDPFTRIGGSQFVILLPDAVAENGKMIARRIAARFHRDYPRKKASFRCSVYDLAEFIQS